MLNELELINNENDLIKSQSNEELINQLLEFQEELKNAKNAVEFIKTELLDRIDLTGENINTKDFIVFKTERKGVKTLDKKMLEDFVRDFGADWEKFHKIGKSSQSIKIEKKKPILIKNI